MSTVPPSSRPVVVMSGLFRSEDMTYVRIIMNDDSAYDTVRELGKFKNLHVIDLSTEATAAAHAGGAVVAASADSSYTYYKKRVAACQFWERKLGSFRETLAQYRVPLPDVLDPRAVQVDDIRSADVVEDCRLYIEPVEQALTKNVIFRKEHKKLINEYLEYLQVLKFNSENQFGSAHSAADFQQENYGEEKHPDVEYGQQRAQKKFTSTICGVIPADKIMSFERLLFRISRGNAFSHFFDIAGLLEDPVTGEKVKKQVFAITFMGEQLARRISRIIGHNGGTEYPIPGSSNEINRLEIDINRKLDDASALLGRTDQEIRELLSHLALDPASAGAMPVRSPFLNWLTALQKERHICNIMKKCDQEGPHSKMITLEGWCPSDTIEELKQALRAAVRVTQAKQAALQVFDHAPNNAEPPTFFKTNKFTSSFQGIVDTYGVPRYKEVNPGLFTIISFPFLFGIMYGDMGHGSLLFMFALFMLWNEKKWLELEKRGQLGEIPSMVFGGRYLLVMMGAFALYAGTIYNDLFSCPINAFGSQWNVPVYPDLVGNETGPANFSQGLYDFSGKPYPYGVDPAWYHTTNELAFFNSMKMKLAVTLGVTQMTFGIILGAFNDIYFKDNLAIFFEFIPRLIFIMCTFGYMVFIIIFKMCVEWGEGSTPPLLIQTMIQMFLSPGSVAKADLLYEGQGTIQAILVLAAVFAVPFMLFPIPCITNVRNKAYLRRHGLRAGGDFDGQSRGKEIQMNDFGLGEIQGGGQRAALSQSLLGDDSSSDEGLMRRPSTSAQVIDDREAKESDHLNPVGSDPADDAGHGEHALGIDYSYSDHLIVQGIHTIEFVLGTVSNTASYLRLWALSLAHAELSAVFWDKMIMQYGLEGSGVYWPVIGFAIWGVATFAVLLCMDVLECFLHALRLHWVEFQNKFFHADGYAFEPFSFDNLDSDIGTSS